MSESSSPQRISLYETALFIESILVPSFNPDHTLDTSSKRTGWMREETVRLNWDAAISSELVDTYGSVSSIIDAETLLDDVRAKLRLQEQEKERERKEQGNI